MDLWGKINNQKQQLKFLSRLYTWNQSSPKIRISKPLRNTINENNRISI